jgi:copper homeostasis protein
MKSILEVIAFNIESCNIAQRAGADRIELCDNPSDGGTTPSYGFIKMAKEVTSIPIFPIIRPRGGDFCYTNEEFEIMKNDVLVCKSLGCEGVVLGLLQHDGTVDNERTKVLVTLAYPMEVTFHRAFDRTTDPFEALETIIECGCSRILTSGQRPSVNEGASLIAELIAAANERIIIMPGSGVRSNNINQLAIETKAMEFHSSARIKVHSDTIFNPSNMNEQLSKIMLDEDEVRKLKAALLNVHMENKS